MNTRLVDYYKMLGVDRLADNKEIERAFRQKAMQTHPDRFPDPIEKVKKTREFQQLNEAYGVLSSYLKRRDYDVALARQEEQERAEAVRKNTEQVTILISQLVKSYPCNGFWCQVTKFGLFHLAEINTMPLAKFIKLLKLAQTFFNATSPEIATMSMTVTDKLNSAINAEIFFMKIGKHGYSWMIEKYWLDSGEPTPNFAEALKDATNHLRAWLDSHPQTQETDSAETEYDTESEESEEPREKFFSEDMPYDEYENDEDEFDQNPGCGLCLLYCGGLILFWVILFLNAKYDLLDKIFPIR